MRFIRDLIKLYRSGKVTPPVFTKSQQQAYDFIRRIYNEDDLYLENYLEFLYPLPKRENFKSEQNYNDNVQNVHLKRGFVQREIEIILDRGLLEKNRKVSKVHAGRLLNSYVYELSKDFRKELGKYNGDYSVKLWNEYIENHRDQEARIRERKYKNITLLVAVAALFIQPFYDIFYNDNVKEKHIKELDSLTVQTNLLLLKTNVLLQNIDSSIKKTHKPDSVIKPVNKLK